MYGIVCKNCKKEVSKTRCGVGPCCDPVFKAELLEQEEIKQKEYERCKKLWFALRSRVLTLEEMEEVFQLDYRILNHINPPYYGGYNEVVAENKLNFDRALLNQFKMRLEQERAAK